MKRRFILTAVAALAFAAGSDAGFKAENGKPQVARSATSWEVAVKSLNLPAEQAKELLELDA